MPSDLSVTEAAHELELDPSRVRALVASGGLRGYKIGGRWLVSWESVAERQREPVPSGRPLSARNAWALLLAASDETEPDGLTPTARWRLRQALMHPGLLALRGRLDRRADVHRFWALLGELRPLLEQPGLVLTGSNAASRLRLELVAPDTVDAYVRGSDLDKLIMGHGLRPPSTAVQANVTLRAVPDDAWLLSEREVAPIAAVALDLSYYTDSRSARVGHRLLAELDGKHRDA
jgi:excisionase family DNA binding protein